ncbi:MAG: hypothetical protein Q8P89_02015 [bacterium]|nr:hypothetical protein [bacterium]
MNQARLEFLKRVANHFQQNPQAKDYLGVSKETSLSTLSLYFSSPSNALDHTDPDFLNDLGERIKLFEGKINQNQGLPETIRLPQQFENRIQEWQKTTGKVDKNLEKKLQKEGQAVREDGEQEIIPKINQARLEPFKSIVSHFETNPTAGDYLGVSRQTCYSTLGLYLSSKDELLAPTDPEFLKKAKEKISFWEGVKTESLIPAGEEDDYKALAEEMRKELTASVGENKIEALEKTAREKVAKGDPLEANEQKMKNLLTVEEGIKNQPPQRQPLPANLDRTFRQWQSELKGLEELGKKEGLGEEILQKKRREIGRKFETPLKNKSLQVWKKVAPKMAPKIEWFLKGASKLAKFTGPIGFALTATLFSYEAIKKAVKYLGAAWYGLHLLFSTLGTAAMVGFVAGSIVGGIAGGIGGAILGAKLGAAIGLAVGGPVGAVIGGILGGIVGFVVGSGVGAIVGGLVLGALGYAVEHWLWQPALSTWSGLGGSLGGLLGGLLGGAGSAIGGFLSWTGGGLAAAGGFVAGLGVQLSAISLPTSLITVPVLGATGGALVFTLWMNTSIVGTAFMRQPAKEDLPPVVSGYIALTKTAQPALLQNSDVEGSGRDITYTIIVGAPNATLTSVRVTDLTIKTSGDGQSEITTDKDGLPITSWTFPQINQGQAQTITYQVHADDSFKDSTVTNSVTVLADVPSVNKPNEIKVARTVVTITASLIAGSCGICNTNEGSLAWRSLLVEAGTAFQVPGALLAGISKLETGVPWRYTDELVTKYSAQGVSMEPCPTSIDGARGAFQFMPSAWAAYGGAVVTAGVRPPGYTPNICNLLDAAYAAAAKMSYDVTTIRDASVCGDGGSELVDPVTGECLAPITVPSSCGWTQQNVYHSAAHYLGRCVDPRFPSVTYCKTVYYTYYQNWQCK